MHFLGFELILYYLFPPLHRRTVLPAILHVNFAFAGFAQQFSKRRSRAFYRCWFRSAHPDRSLPNIHFFSEFTTVFTRMNHTFGKGEQPYPSPIRDATCHACLERRGTGTPKGKRPHDFGPSDFPPRCTEC